MQTIETFFKLINEKYNKSNDYKKNKYVETKK